MFVQTLENHCLPFGVFHVSLEYLKSLRILSNVEICVSEAPQHTQCVQDFSGILRDLLSL